MTEQLFPASLFPWLMFVVSTKSCCCFCCARGLVHGSMWACGCGVVAAMVTESVDAAAAGSERVPQGYVAETFILLSTQFCINYGVYCGSV